MLGTKQFNRQSFPLVGLLANFQICDITTHAPSTVSFGKNRRGKGDAAVVGPAVVERKNAPKTDIFCVAVKYLPKLRGSVSKELQGMRRWLPTMRRVLSLISFVQVSGRTVLPCVPLATNSYRQDDHTASGTFFVGSSCVKRCGSIPASDPWRLGLQGETLILSAARCPACHS